MLPVSGALDLPDDVIFIAGTIRYLTEYGVADGWNIVFQVIVAEMAESRIVLLDPGVLASPVVFKVVLVVDDLEIKIALRFLPRLAINMDRADKDTGLAA